MFVLSSMRSDCYEIEYRCLHEQQWCVLVVKFDSILGLILKTLHFGDEDGHLKKFIRDGKCIFKRCTRIKAA